jgi:hypothetical protein
MLRNARKVLLTICLLLPLLVSGVAVAQAAPEADQPNTAVDDVTVLSDCDWRGCGTAANGTSRGFHVTVNWGQPWNDENVKWVGPFSTYGLPQWVDVDGIYVGSGCRMTGLLTGRPPLPHPPIPFSWGPGWHQFHNNQTAAGFWHT